MAKFVDIGEGRYRNLETIRSIQVKEDSMGYRKLIAYDQAGNLGEVDPYKMLEWRSQILQAQPGFFVCVHFKADDREWSDDLTLEPVIGWHVSVQPGYSGATQVYREPITYEDRCGNCCYDYVLYPDGSVVSPDVRYPNIEAFKADLRRDRAAYLAYKAQSPKPNDAA